MYGILCADEVRRKTGYSTSHMYSIRPTCRRISGGIRANEPCLEGCTNIYYTIIHDHRLNISVVIDPIVSHM
jgi:hypothetical protein